MKAVVLTTGTRLRRMHALSDEPVGQEPDRKPS